MANSGIEYRFEWDKVEAFIKEDLETDHVKLLSFTIFKEPYEDGTNVGEFEIEYRITKGSLAGRMNHAIYGLYTNDKIILFMN